MFDIHCHIIPGVDDGSASLDESREMLEMAARDGTDGIVCTPHTNIPDSYINHWSHELSDKVRTLRGISDKNGIGIRLYTGQEVFLDGDFISLIRQGKIITLNSSVYLLCEFDFTERAQSAYEKLRRITAEGIVPIVAHPERYRFVAEDSTAPAKLKEAGALLQINAASLFGGFGKAAEAVAHTLLRRRICDFVASDAHSPYSRTPCLGEAYDAVCELYSADYADVLFCRNPAKAIGNKKIFCC